MANNKDSIYPEAHTGPMSDKHSSYAQPKKWSGKRDKDVPYKVVIFIGMLIAIGMFFLIKSSTQIWDQ